MHTLFDFITHVKGVEYILSLTFIAGYILYSEVLKPKPFGTVARTGRDDLSYLRETGRKNTYRTIGRIVSAPFIGLAYVVALPFVFAYAIFSAIMGAVLGTIGREAAFGWRPAEAYLTGRKKGKKQEEKTADEKE
jgi:hypothetical protein